MEYKHKTQRKIREECVRNLEVIGWKWWGKWRMSKGRSECMCVCVIHSLPYLSWPFWGVPGQVTRGLLRPSTQAPPSSPVRALPSSTTTSTTTIYTSLWVLKQHLRRPLSLSGPSKVTTTHFSLHFSPSPPTLSTSSRPMGVQWLCASSYKPRPEQLRVFSRRGWARENDARVDWPGESNHNKDAMLDFRLRSRTRLWRHTQTLSYISLTINIITHSLLIKLVHERRIILMGHRKSSKLRHCKKKHAAKLFTNL